MRRQLRPEVYFSFIEFAPNFTLLGVGWDDFGNWGARDLERNLNDGLGKGRGRRIDRRETNRLQGMPLRVHSQPKWLNHLRITIKTATAPPATSAFIN